MLPKQWARFIGYHPYSCNHLPPLHLVFARGTKGRRGANHHTTTPRQELHDLLFNGVGSAAKTPRIRDRDEQQVRKPPRMMQVQNARGIELCVWLGWEKRKLAKWLLAIYTKTLVSESRLGLGYGTRPGVSKGNGTGIAGETRVGRLRLVNMMCILRAAMC